MADLAKFLSSGPKARNPLTDAASLAQNSLTRRIVGGVASPLAAIGNTLDVATGASSVRDILAGENPFDQFATKWWEDAGNRTGGRELLRKHGLVGNKDTWGNAAAGLAAEVLLDPTTYLTFGASALTKGGTVAKMANILPKTRLGRMGGTLRQAIKAGGPTAAKDAARALKAAKLPGELRLTPELISKYGSAEKAINFLRSQPPRRARLKDLADQRMGNFANVHAPFSSSTEGFTGGKGGLKVAGALDAAGKAVGDSAVGRGFKQLFDPRVKGFFKPKDQDLAGLMTDAGEKSHPQGYLQGKEDLDYFTENVDPLWQSQFADAPAHHLPHILSLAGETVRDGDFLKSTQRAFKHITGQEGSPELVDAIAKGVERLSGSRNDTYGYNLARGAKGGKLEGHAPRRVTDEWLESKGKARSREGLLKSPSMNARRTHLAAVPEVMLREMQLDRSLTKGKLAERTQRILKLAKDVYDVDLGYTGWKKNEKGFMEAVERTPEEHAERLAKFLYKSRGKGGADPIFVHDIDPLKHHAEYVQSQRRVGGNLDAIHEFLVKNTNTQTGIPLVQTLKEIGLNPETSIQHLAELRGTTPERLAKMRVDRDAYSAIKASREYRRLPMFMETIGPAIDKATQWFKNNVTVPWPNFHLRNLMGGQYNWAASGLIGNAKDARLYGKSVEAATHLFGRGEEDKLIREMVAHRVLDPFSAGDIPTEELADTLSKDFWNVPGTARKVATDVDKAPWKIEQNPIVGAASRVIRKGYGTMLETGKKTAAATEFMNRVPGYLYLRKKGYSPAAAAKEVERLQFDYSKVTPAEKHVFRRVSPFWTFMKKNMELTFDTLAQRPGGVTGQMIRAIGAGKEDNEVMPTELSNTTAIPLNPLKDGSKRYLSGFGLPFEAATPYLAAPLGLEHTQDAGLEYLSSFNPYLKYPLEGATGQTFFQRGLEGGRPLRELDPTMARLAENVATPFGRGQGLADAAKRVPGWMALEHAAANSPGAKYLSSARTLTDQRKWQNRDMVLPDALTNLLSPARITTVSPQRQERLLQQASNVLADNLGAKSWKNRYFKKEDIARAQQENPLLAAQMQALNNLWKDARKKATKYSKPSEKRKD